MDLNYRKPLPKSISGVAKIQPHHRKANEITMGPAGGWKLFYIHIMSAFLWKAAPCDECVLCVRH